MNVFAPTNAILKPDPTALLDFRSSWAIRQQHNWNVLNFNKQNMFSGFYLLYLITISNYIGDYIGENTAEIFQD